MSMIPTHHWNHPSPAEATLLIGDRMARVEFHRRYERCPQDQKWELIAGVAFRAPPVTLPHSDYTGEISLALDEYEIGTPGTEVLANTTIFLGRWSEPQPDCTLRISPEFGGQTRNHPDQYIEGPPELIAEVAYSTRALEMHAKRDDFRRQGVAEYLVICIEELQLHWFDFAGSGMIRPDRRGISHSRIFPGLWLDTAALLRLDSHRLRGVVALGLASRAHAAFVRRLERQRRRLAGR
jgi:Uma2 family endonuclease